MLLAHSRSIPLIRLACFSHALLCFSTPSPVPFSLTAYTWMQGGEIRKVKQLARNLTLGKRGSGLRSDKISYEEWNNPILHYAN